MIQAAIFLLIPILTPNEKPVCLPNGFMLKPIVEQNMGLFDDDGVRINGLLVVDLIWNEDTIFGSGFRGTDSSNEKKYFVYAKGYEHPVLYENYLAFDLYIKEQGLPEFPHYYTYQELSENPQYSCR